MCIVGVCGIECTMTLGSRWSALQRARCLRLCRETNNHLHSFVPQVRSTSNSPLGQLRHLRIEDTHRHTSSCNVDGAGQVNGKAGADDEARDECARTTSKPIQTPTTSRRKKRTPPFPDPYALPPPPSSFPAYESRDFFRFEIIHESSRSRARVGRIHTPHGVVDTPSFVAVGTNAALKAVDHRIVEKYVQLMFCNTYHLILHPGPDVVKEAGGIHQFMNRNAPIITDSGGFQVFSLHHGSVHDEINMKSRKPKRVWGSENENSESSNLLKVTEEGALFRSYRDGTKIMLTPESSVAAQKAYASDIIVPLDELPPYHIDPDRLERSVLLSHRWEARSLRAHLDNVQKQAMYAVIHGGMDERLRQMSIDYLSALPFDGFGIGGSLGKDRKDLFQLLNFVMPQLPASKPNHLLGIADTESIRGAVPLGVDTFDSCFPTRLGRHGTILTKRFGRVSVASGKWKKVFEPPDWEGGLQGHTLAYLHHLVKSHEPMAGTLLTLHNILHMAEYMAAIRAQILEDEI